MRDNSSAAVRIDLEDQLFTKVENWRRSQQKIPSRSEAVRLLLAQALKLDVPHAA
jgi:metal-responsive CopG/Arc/MetJ family transcriptional regulator